MVDAVVEDCPRSGGRPHKVLWCRERRVKNIACGLEDGCFWGCEDGVRVIEDGVAADSGSSGPALGDCGVGSSGVVCCGLCGVFFAWGG